MSERRVRRGSWPAAHPFVHLVLLGCPELGEPAAQAGVVAYEQLNVGDLEFV